MELEIEVAARWYEVVRIICRGAASGIRPHVNDDAIIVDFEALQATDPAAAARMMYAFDHLKLAREIAVRGKDMPGTRSMLERGSPETNQTRISTSGGQSSRSQTGRYTSSSTSLAATSAWGSQGNTAARSIVPPASCSPAWSRGPSWRCYQKSGRIRDCYQISAPPCRSSTVRSANAGRSVEMARVAIVHPTPGVMLTVYVKAELPGCGRVVVDWTTLEAHAEVDGVRKSFPDLVKALQHVSNQLGETITDADGKLADTLEIGMHGRGHAVDLVSGIRPNPRPRLV